MLKLQLDEFNRALKDTYISNRGVVNLDDTASLYDDIMLITASCGRGKTTYSLSIGEDGLLAEINRIRRKRNLLDISQKDIEPDDVLFLSSRKGQKHQQLKNKNVVCAIANDYQKQKELDFTGGRKGKFRLTTAHQYGHWIAMGQIEIPPKIIIIDEIHSIFAETVFCEELRQTLAFIEEHYSDMIKIGLTATPQFLFNYVRNDKIKFSIIDKDLGAKYKVKNINAYIKGSAETILKELKPQINHNNKVIYYTQSATQCYKLSVAFGANSAFLISDYNESKNDDGRLLVDIMQEYGIKQYILDNEIFPADIDIIFINSACREGINIKDKAVNTVICEAVDLITIEQILGRIRKDIENFMIVCNYRNYERTKSNIEQAEKFLNDVVCASNPKEEMILQYGRQEGNRNLQKLVYRYNGEYRINEFAKAYLEYINECYIQISNYETNSKCNYIKQVADRDLLLCADYLGQLSRNAENGNITIETVWKATIQKNHDNALEAFKSIETQWLDKPLGKEEKTALCVALAVVRDKGKKAGWNTIKGMLLDGGYQISDKRLGKERKTVSVISR